MIRKEGGPGCVFLVVDGDIQLLGFGIHHLGIRLGMLKGSS